MKNLDNLRAKKRLKTGKKTKRKTGRKVRDMADEIRDPWLLLKVVRMKDLNARIIIHATKGRQGGMLRNREISFAVNGETVVPDDQRPWTTNHRGRFARSVALKLGENIVEAWDVATGKLVSDRVFIREEKEKTPAEKKLEEIKLQTQQVKAKKELAEAKKKLPPPVVKDIVIQHSGKPGDYEVVGQVVAEGVTGKRKVRVSEVRGLEAEVIKDTDENGCFKFSAKFQELERTYLVTDIGSGKSGRVRLFGSPL